MPIDADELLEAAETAREDTDEKSKSLNATIAVSIAVLATFMGICQVKAGNVVQGMQVLQTEKVDSWAFYQARNIRQAVAESTITQLELAKLGAPPQSVAAYDEAITKYRTFAADQDRKKALLKDQAEQHQKDFEALSIRDDQFDISEALTSIAIALFAVTALTGIWALYWAALVPAALGVMIGLAGLVGLNIYSAALAKIFT